MDFFKSVLPPLPKLPKLKKIRQWNGGSLLNLHQFPHLPAAFNLGGSVPAAPATTTSTRRQPALPRGDCVHPPHGPAPPPARAQPPQHMRHSSDISIISAAVSSRTPADYSHRDNLGLYALKCDRSAAKRGILLHLPRKITQAVGGSGDMTVQHGAPAMVHEKFSPCKRHPPAMDAPLPEIRPPPRRRKRPPPAVAHQRQPPAGPPEADLSRWQKNSSELFRIVERESATAARARSAGGLGMPRAKKPHRAAAAAPAKSAFLDAPTSSSDGVVELVQQTKAQSVDNLLAVRYHRRRRGAFAEPERSRDVTDSESSDRQVQSLRHHQPPSHHHHRRTSSAAGAEIVPTTAATQRAPLRTIRQQQQPPASGSTSLPPAGALDRACDFSIDNNSDEIEVRFRRGYSTDGSSDATTTVAAIAPPPAQATEPSKMAEKLPLPPRVLQLRRTDSDANRGRWEPGAGVPKHEPKGETPDPTPLPPPLPPPPPPPPPPATLSALPAAPPGSGRAFTPLAEVLRKSIDNAELKRKWLNDFLSQGSEGEPCGDGPGRPAVTAMELEEAFVPQLDIVQRMDRQLAELESGGTGPPHHRQGSAGSVDIFRRPACDFDEFDELFTPAEEEQHPAGRKTVKLSERVTCIERDSTTSNLCFSSSSFSCASLEDGKPPALPPTAPPPPPPPLPPPAPVCLPFAGGAARRRWSAGSDELVPPCRSTVKIQDYSGKHQHLQRVRYLSSPSPSRSSTVAQPPDGDSGGSVDSGEPHAKGNTNAVHPGGGGSTTVENSVSTSSRKMLPVPENLTQARVAQNGHWTGVERQGDQHTARPDRLSSTGTGGVNNSNHSVLPDYSEYYNEEGVIII